MPRDFVPCLYLEREMSHVEDYGSVKRCEVVELFALMDVVTEQSGIIMTTDSHAHFIDTDVDDMRAREHLFGIFYAAMAALE